MFSAVAVLNSSEDELQRVLNDDFSLHYLSGSDGYSRHVDPPGSAHMHTLDSCKYLSRPDKVGAVDVVELVGGESGVGKLCVRRRLTRGADFDIVRV